MTISIKDIARKCNLSVSTVSRALNNQYGVSDKAKQKVEKAVSELGYVPHMAAKELVNKKSNLIGFILAEYDYEVRPAFFELLPYLNKVLKDVGKESIISTVSYSKYKSGDLEKIIRTRNYEGCIIFPGFLEDHPILSDAIDLKVPTVLVEQDVVGPTCSSINTDEILGAQAATQYLIDAGHRNIGFVNGVGEATISKQRFKGYKQTLLENNLTFKKEFVIESDYTGEGGALSGWQLLKKNPEITAIFFANDVMAMGAIKTFYERGIHVPEDLSVIGYDDMFVSEFYNPPLTTVKINHEKIAINAGGLLLELLNGEEGRKELVHPELIIRSSATQLE